MKAITPPIERAVLLEPRSKKPIAGSSWKTPPSLKAYRAHRGNYGVRCGAVPGDDRLLWVLDFDLKAGGHHAYDQLVAEHGGIPGLRVRTGGGGLHIYLAGAPADAHGRRGGQNQPSRRFSVGDYQVELKANGTYVAAPGSIHPSGGIYQPEDPSEWCKWPKPKAFPQAPRWLNKLVKYDRIVTAGCSGGGLDRTGIGSISPDVYVPLLTGSEINSQHKALCPLHEDHEPTLHVSPDHWYCSACEVGGRIRALAAATLGLGEQRGHAWRIDSLDDRATVKAYLAELFPEVK